MQTSVAENSKGITVALNKLLKNVSKKWEMRYVENETDPSVKVLTMWISICEFTKIL